MQCACAFSVRVLPSSISRTHGVSAGVSPRSTARRFRHGWCGSVAAGSRLSIGYSMDGPHTHPHAHRHDPLGVEYSSSLQHPLQEPRARRLTRILNASSKWVVVALVIAILAWKHDNEVLWAVTGSILNTGNSKLLKRVFNQQRPLTALGLKADPGMPSSHAQSLAYLSVYAALALILWWGWHISAIGAAAVVLLCGAYLAWLRISEGLHTPAQVIVGVLVGSSTAYAWIALWRGFVREAIAASLLLRYCLYCASGFSMICFSIFGVRKWRLGEA